MSRPTVIAALCAVPLAAAVWIVAGGSEDPQPGDPAVEARAALLPVIDRLASPERSERLAAERDLLDRGPSVLPYLPVSKDVRDPAARAALDRVRKRLEEQSAEQSVRPTLINLQANGPLAEVFGERGLGSIPRAWLVFSSSQAERQVKVDAVQQPFWVVVDDLSAQAGLWPDRMDPTGRLRTEGLSGVYFRDRTPDDDAKRIAYSHAFRLAAGPVSQRPVAGDDRQRLVRVPLEVRTEPKLRPLFVSYAARDFQLTAEGGQAAPSFTPDAKLELPLGEQGGAADLRLDFVTSGKPRGPLKLSGKVRVTVAVGEQWFTRPFNPPQDAPPPKRDQTRGGVTVRFREMTLRPDGTAEVEIAVVYDHGGPAFESHRAWVYHNTAELHFKTEHDGSPSIDQLAPEQDSSTVAQGDGGVVLRYRFVGVPPGAEQVYFAYVAPTNIVEVPAEFSIDGLTIADDGTEAP